MGDFHIVPLGMTCQVSIQRVDADGERLSAVNSMRSLMGKSLS